MLSVRVREASSDQIRSDQAHQRNKESEAPVVVWIVVIFFRSFLSARERKGEATKGASSRAVACFPKSHQMLLLVVQFVTRQRKMQDANAAQMQRRAVKGEGRGRGRERARKGLAEMVFAQ